jgi:hypothetical protein
LSKRLRTGSKNYSLLDGGCYNCYFLPGEASKNGQIAQLVERSPEKAGVGGSIPSLATILLRLPPFNFVQQQNGGPQMANQTQPRTIKEWIRYIVVAVVALWLVVWMLRISGISIF